MPTDSDGQLVVKLLEWKTTANDGAFLAELAAGPSARLVIGQFNQTGQDESTYTDGNGNTKTLTTLADVEEALLELLNLRDVRAVQITTQTAAGRHHTHYVVRHDRVPVMHLSHSTNN